MKVSELARERLVTCQIGTTVCTVAERMREHDVGFVPVLRGSELVGVVTDRDLAIRVVGPGLDLGTAVGEVMSSPVQTCGPDTDILKVQIQMARYQILSVVVVDAAGAVIRVVSLADIAQVEEAALVGDLVSVILQTKDTHGFKNGRRESVWLP